VSTLAQNGHAAPYPVTSGDNTEPRYTVPHRAHRRGRWWAAKHTVASSTVSKASAGPANPGRTGTPATLVCTFMRHSILLSIKEHGKRTETRLKVSDDEIDPPRFTIAAKS
jgi:hypothetical protein